MTIHNVYAKLLPGEVRAVDHAFRAAYESLALSGYPSDNGDDAERLVEAIAVYLKARDDASATCQVCFDADSIPGEAPCEACGKSTP